MKNGADIIRDLAATPRMYNFATVTDENKPWVRYVFGSADESFAISFATCISSRKVTHIRKMKPFI